MTYGTSADMISSITGRVESLNAKIQMVQRSMYGDQDKWEAIQDLKRGGDRKAIERDMVSAHDQAVRAVAMANRLYNSERQRLLNFYDTGKLNAERQYFEQRIRDLAARGEPDPAETLKIDAMASGDAHKIKALENVLEGFADVKYQPQIYDLRSATDRLTESKLAAREEGLRNSLRNYGHIQARLDSAYQSLTGQQVTWSQQTPYIKSRERVTYDRDPKTRKVLRMVIDAGDQVVDLT
jgi:hypothetical protein